LIGQLTDFFEHIELSANKNALLSFVPLAS
jgi:hypothetical protein